MAAAQLAIAYDGSPSAVTAVRVAGALLAGAKATIVTVPEPPPQPVRGASRFLMNVPSGTLERALEEIAAQAVQEARTIAAEGVGHAAGLDAEPLVTKPHTPAWEALLDAARGADALVCGARGRSELARTVLGSTSTSLLHHAELPLLVIPDDCEPADGPVLIAYDGSPAADRAIDLAGRLLAGRAAVVVHVYESQYRDSRAVRALAHGEVKEIVQALDEALTDEAGATTEQGVVRARAAGLDATGETIEASQGVWRTISALARDRDAGLVVTGSRGQGGARSVLLGSVSSGLVHHAEAPVLVGHADQ
ncbi:universal stress protein [Solirubrobacter sp. CPCC 204708]|uniref:Universal stress protein n=1 Tax=Solirubrobacter deserti TaxID=2282478 RepID=A0ABT4RCL8_9ACTN|nr:universal stress protein [Solirubrobacter deserti]MBE2315650.1 universal stress protein [Solirubrobacter deserti]MDA0136290.1 universal stress protein [Solirubrobacter deserti]